MSDVERTELYRAFDRETTRWLRLAEENLKQKEGNDEGTNDGE